ncbi:AlpA family phage regulatory protein [Thalassospira sp.]|uniref:helix-turn-helix transcriptional regulator n=1 Tax=Thalassospira sp. TaxID=1912094 RepID=UPI001B29472D|nr:AlpA family phage regulatory protein [Thalassospira sp.]MBO6807274.1 AlpA family phage regulatory protein [Thalassospira sp.]MBO6841681.1 AlpA family phage regulatory protein [Thalassospira sp.]
MSMNKSETEVFLSIPDIQKRYSISRASVYNLINKQAFPSPIKVLPGLSRFKLSDIEQWENKVWGK